MLRPTFLSFETARKAVTAAQFGMDTVGHNMSNQNTPGYTRQRVDQVSFALNSRSRFSTFGQQLPGQGTLITGINRIRDPFLDNRYRIEASNVGGLEVKNLALSDINKVFDEIQTDGLHAKFDEFIDAFAKLETDATSSEFKLVIRTQAEQIAMMLGKYATDLNGVEAQQLSDFKVEMSSLSEVLSQLAFYNEKIEQQHIYGNPANELMDDRDLLLDQLAAMTDIVVERKSVQISEERSIERLVVKMNDPAGTVLADGNRAVQFSLDQSTGSAGEYVLNMTDLDGIPSSDVGHLFEKGSIRGYLDILNGKGNFADRAAGENAERGIPYFRAALDSFAKSFADEMNWLNSGAQVDAVSGDRIIDPDQMLFVNRLDSTGDITAENIAISQNWRNSLDFLTTHEGGDPKFIQRFKQALGITQYDIPNGTDSFGSPVPVKGTFQEYLVAFQAEMAQDLKMNKTLLDSADRVLSGLQDNRDDVSAVSMNEESINMMTYQNYYNAALRYMTTLDEALDKIINGMGVVGR